MKNFNNAIKEYRKLKRQNDYKPVLTYNFLSNNYYIFLFYSKHFIENKFSKTHEIIC